MKKACIFDLDGTLLYSLVSIAEAGNRMLAHFGYPPEPEAAYGYYSGEGADKLVERILFKNEDHDPAHYEEGCRVFRGIIKDLASYGVYAYEGVPAMLTALKAAGVKLAVCTNKPDNAAQKAVRDMFGEQFDYICGQKPGLRLKPSPDAPLHIAEELGVTPEECLYIGDTATDMKTGKAAGMATVGVLWGYRTYEELRDNDADIIIEKPAEIIALAV